MAARVPLPKVASLPEAILFHRESPRDPTVILQVPNADRSDAQTYVLSLENMADVGWLEGLPNPKELRHQLDLEQHLVYYPGTGYIKAVADLDAPSEIQKFMAKARVEGAHRPDNIMDRLWTRSRLAGRSAPVSGLRQALTDRGRHPRFGGLR